jgi:hypothetical protein
VNQQDRMNSALNAWEADPWDASDAIADAQLAGFELRAAKPVRWTTIGRGGDEIFGIAVRKLAGLDVTFLAEHGGEEMLVMQLLWHGFPDPPEYRLATRPAGQTDVSWSSWGYFDAPPTAWIMPEPG